MAKSFEQAISAGEQKSTDLTDWRKRHNIGAAYPNSNDAGIVNLLRGWYYYAVRHEYKFGSKIGDDGVLGPEWAQIGYALRGLLNGDLGQLDGGTCDAFILDTMKENAIEVEE